MHRHDWVLKLALNAIVYLLEDSKRGWGNISDRIWTAWGEK